MSDQQPHPPHEDTPELGWVVSQLAEPEVRFLYEIARDPRMNAFFKGDVALTMVGLTVIMAGYDTYSHKKNSPSPEEQEALRAIQAQIAALTGTTDELVLEVGLVAVAAALAAAHTGATTAALEQARGRIFLDACANPNARTELDPAAVPVEQEQAEVEHTSDARIARYPGPDNPYPDVFALAVKPTPFAFAAYLHGWAYRHDNLLLAQLNGRWLGGKILEAHDPVFFALYEGFYTDWRGGSRLTRRQRRELDEDEADTSQERLWERLFMLGYCGGRLILPQPRQARQR